MVWRMPWITAQFLYSRAPTHLTSVLVRREAPLRSLPGRLCPEPSRRIPIYRQRSYVLQRGTLHLNSGRN
jgi:hypothetical protein